jgi:Family of unknown function (DUF6370)
MKKWMLLLLVSITSLIATAQTAPAQNKILPSSDIMQIVEAACGQCKFGIKGDDCNLAVRINGKAFFVDGSKIDDHGDAHADDGFCNKIRKAKVSGRIVNNHFAASSFTLLKEEKGGHKN